MFKNKRHQAIPKLFQSVTADTANNLNVFHSDLSTYARKIACITLISLAYRQEPRPTFGGNFQTPEGRPKHQAGQS